MAAQADAPPKTVGDDEGLSEYEQSRARNIERNNARLRSLGLITVAEERRSNDLAWGRQPQRAGDEDGCDEEEDDSSSDEEYAEGNQSKRKRKKGPRSSAPDTKG